MAQLIRRLIRPLIPDREMVMPVLTGPFRGAKIQLHPRHCMRKALGIYEHELNGWLKAVLPRVNKVIDVGANDGYFTFGSAAAFQRFGIVGEIIAFEPDAYAFSQLQESLNQQQHMRSKITLDNRFVGATSAATTATLDEIARARDDSEFPRRALIKIDVEGAELDVIAGASLWLDPSNYFLIEVHEHRFLEVLTRDFLRHEMKLVQVDQRPFPLLGYEVRSRENWWLVSEPLPR